MPTYMPKRFENKYSNKYLYTNVHSSIIFNIQKVEKTQMLIKCLSTEEYINKICVCVCVHTQVNILNSYLFSTV